MDEAWLQNFLSHPDMAPNRTGHTNLPAGPPEWGGRASSDEQIQDTTTDLGLGWVYYALIRALRPETVVCIGSGRGFVPVILAKALADAGARMPLTFVDPSFDDDFWKEPDNVSAWFDEFGIAHLIDHRLMTTEQFASTHEFASLPPIDFLFVDGGHFYEDVRKDYELLVPKLDSSATMLMHDTVSRSANPKWSGPRQVILELIETDVQWQILDLPFGAGVTVVRRRPPHASETYLDRLRAEWPDPDSTEF